MQGKNGVNGGRWDGCEAAGQSFAIQKSESRVQTRVAANGSHAPLVVCINLGSDDKEQGPIPRLFPLFSSSFFSRLAEGVQKMASTEIRLSEAKASAAECQEASCLLASN